MEKNPWSKVRDAASRNFDPERKAENEAQKTYDLTRPQPGDTERVALMRKELGRLTKPSDLQPALTPSGNLRRTPERAHADEKARRVARLVTTLTRHDEGRRKTRARGDRER